MPAASPTTDRIEKRVSLKAPQARVWRALADSAEFGTWFQIRFDSPFAEGQRIKGRILVPGYEHVTAEFQIIRIQPERYFAYRWHPYAVDPKVDYEREHPTLVTFTLRDAPGNGTLLTVTETGFENVPPHRRLG